MGRQRREKAGQESGQHIPEEVLHGDTLLSEDGPGEVVYAIPSAASITPVTVSIHSCPIRQLTPRPTDRGRADRPSLRKPWRSLRGFSYFVLFFTVFIVFYLISSYFHFFAKIR